MEPWHDPRTATPAELLAAVADAAPDLGVISTLMMIDASRLTPAEAVEYLCVHQRVASWWAALQTPAFVAAASDHPTVDEYVVLLPDDAGERTIRIEEAARDELAAALRQSSVAIQAQIDISRLLVGPLHRTQDAWAEGLITAAHARVIAEAAARLPGAGASADDDPRAVLRFLGHCIRLQDRVLPVARRSSLSLTRRAANRAVLAIDADGHARRRRSAILTSDVFVMDDVDGMSLLAARMPTERAHAACRLIDAVARSLHEPDDGRTIGEVRVDVLDDAIRAPLRDAGATVGQAAAARVSASLRVNLDVLVPLDALVGADGEPAELIGHGPIGGPELAGLMGDPDAIVVLRRIVTDPLDGGVLDYGRCTYEIPNRLRRALSARDLTCRFPGCRRPARRCQVDHVEPWESGGATSLCNCGLLCTRHHQQKTHGGWEILRSMADGAATWRSPGGRIHERPPGLSELRPHAPPDVPPF